MENNFRRTGKRYTDNGVNKYFVKSSQKLHGIKVLKKKTPTTYN